MGRGRVTAPTMTRTMGRVGRVGRRFGWIASLCRRCCGFEFGLAKPVVRRRASPPDHGRPGSIEPALSARIQFGLMGVDDSCECSGQDRLVDGARCLLKWRSMPARNSGAVYLRVAEGFLTGPALRNRVRHCGTTNGSDPASSTRRSPTGPGQRDRAPAESTRKMARGPVRVDWYHPERMRFGGFPGHRVW